jgi:hypothetical protein
MVLNRPLTHDEKKASEAAFRGLPFNSAWSQSAKSVYDGIIQAMKNTSMPPLVLNEQLPNVSDLGITPIPRESEQTPSSEHLESQVEPVESSLNSTRKPLHSRREAIESGLLMDITPTAQSLGIDLAVGVTKPLWEHGIMAMPDLSESEVQARVRDMLLAVRLRLASLKTPTPIVEIPILLSLSPELTPQIFSIYALFHKDSIESDCLLLIHPGEVAFADRSFLQN